tara:strand:+ start:281 stop:556 length:276 start_codon:yes stop_codon:yes gene_type:complete
VALEVVLVEMEVEQLEEQVIHLLLVLLKDLLVGPPKLLHMVVPEVEVALLLSVLMERVVILLMKLEETVEQVQQQVLLHLLLQEQAVVVEA